MRSGSTEGICQGIPGSGIISWSHQEATKEKVVIPIVLATSLWFDPFRALALDLLAWIFSPLGQVQRL